MNAREQFLLNQLQRSHKRTDIDDVFLTQIKTKQVKFDSIEVMLPFTDLEGYQWVGDVQNAYDLFNPITGHKIEIKTAITQISDSGRYMERLRAIIGKLKGKDADILFYVYDHEHDKILYIAIKRNEYNNANLTLPIDIARRYRGSNKWYPCDTGRSVTNLFKSIEEAIEYLIPSFNSQKTVDIALDNILSNEITFEAI